jgi:hypothetical protein
LRNVLESTTGNRLLASFVASEFATLYYSLLAWRRRLEPKETDLTFDRNSGWGTMVAGLSMAIVAESIALHLWISRSSQLAAWTLTILDLYGILWLVGDLRAFKLRRSTVSDGALDLRFGLRWKVRVDASQIESVERAPVDRPKAALRLTLLNEPQFLIRLREQTTFHGMYGVRKTTNRIALNVDQPDRVEDWARKNSLWLEPPVAAAPAPAEPKPAARISREEWMRRRPDYIPIEDWIRSLPPE